MNCKIYPDSMTEKQRRRALARAERERQLATSISNDLETKFHQTVENTVKKVALVSAATGSVVTLAIVVLWLNFGDGCRKSENNISNNPVGTGVSEISKELPKPAKSAAMFIGEHDLKKIVTKAAAKDFLAQLKEYLAKNPDKVKDVLDILLKQKDILSEEVKGGLIDALPKDSVSETEKTEFTKSIKTTTTKKKKINVIAEPSSADKKKNSPQKEESQLGKYEEEEVIGR